jgi:hypothetical protein
MLMTDLFELKKVLEIDPQNTVEDGKLSLFVQWATEIIESVLNRPGFTYSSRTEYYSGQGTQKLLLRHRPVYTTPTIQVWVDHHGFYGSSEGAFGGDVLVYGQDFCVQLDEEGRPSKSGILVRINTFWPRPAVRVDGLLSPFLSEAFGNIKVVYSGGYTVDTLPADFRLATIALVTKMRGFFPTGFELSSDGYMDKNISIIAERRDYLTSLTKQLLFKYRNMRF